MNKRGREGFIFSFLAIGLISLLFLTSCDDWFGTSLVLEDIKIATDFTAPSIGAESRGETMKTYTPTAYSIGVKSAILKGADGTADYAIVSKEKLTESEPFSFTTEDGDAKSLIATAGNDFIQGSYESLELVIHYLQMTLDTYIDGSKVSRTLRIYLSDDSSASEGSGGHKAGDVTAINGDGEETGWLMGNAYDNFTGITPREDAYQDELNRWLVFAGKNSEEYGPFGDASFKEIAQPYTEKIELDFNLRNAKTILITFNVGDTWNCDDINGDEHFNPDDAKEDWHMNLPDVTAKSLSE